MGRRANNQEQAANATGGESVTARKERLQASVNNMAHAMVSSGPRVGMIEQHLEALMKHYDAQDYTLLPHICDQRSGRNLAGLVTEIMGHGWGGRYNSFFRKLVLRGFDTSIQQKNGTTPSLMALQNDAHNLHEDDLRWAFRHGLNPLAHYPDMVEGRSLLSVDFGPRGDVFELYVINTIKRKLKALDPAQQGTTLGMLVVTARDEWQPALAKIKKAMLEQGLEQVFRNQSGRATRKL